MLIVGDKISRLRERKVAPQSLQHPINEHPDSEFKRRQRTARQSIQTMYIMAYLGAKDVQDFAAVGLSYALF